MSTGIHLVVTDLDGSLLDHDDYSYEAAKPVLELLEELRIPVVLASSKTRAEMLKLRAELDNEHPFIVENGAAIWIPQNYFLKQPAHTTLRDEHWVRELAPPRSQWLEPLAALRESLPGTFTDFASAGAEGIAAMTGLSIERATLANEREYSEPVQWHGSEDQLQEFYLELSAAGATVARGGRFYSVGGNSDKGRALLWLRKEYALAAGAAAVYDLAVGDGENDVPMLEVAHTALQIPAKDRPLPPLKRNTGVLLGEGYGPDGWSSGVTQWLRELYQAREES